MTGEELANGDRLPRVLAVIPGRGGSKRLPRKNVLPLAGHPLIAHTIMAAAKSKYLTDWLVSSEDEEILEVARRYGAPIPFVRPRELAGDEVRNIDVLRHALEYMESVRNTPYDLIMLLQPTCPVRKPEHIDQAVRMLWASDLETLASVKGPFKKRDPNLKRVEQGVLCAYCPQAEGMDWAPFYVYNASIYLARRDYFLREKQMISPHQVPLVMDAFCSLDVDELQDLILVEAALHYLANNRATPQPK